MKTLLILLLPVLCFSQKKMVLIEGFQTVNVMGFHKIAVDDEVSVEAVKKFVFYMERNPIDYEDAIRKVSMIRTIQADRYFIGEFKNGIITLNDRLNRFPYTKQVVILNYLAENNGAKMNTDFNITDFQESVFERRVKGNAIYIEITNKLIEESPLTSKQ